MRIPAGHSASGLLDRGMTTELDAQRCRVHLTGRTGVFSHRGDPRFAYCLYVPPEAKKGLQPGLVIAVHDSLRNFGECRDGLTDFAERHHLVVLAPLFPIDALGNGNPDGYKYLVEDGFRYDLLLDAMVNEVASRTGCEREKFFLYGYSGGAHFAHRYLLLHPERVRAAAIGSPGQVTLLDFSADWWAGVRNVETVFGRPLQLEAIRRVPLKLVVGAADTNPQEVGHAPQTRYWHAKAHEQGATRVDRIMTLQRSLKEAGIDAELELLPGRDHTSALAPAMSAAAFFERHTTA